jgi:tRNA (guanine-N7-)-methyltransferase
MGKKLLAHEYFKAPPYDVLLQPASLKGRWDAPFGRKSPLHVEIGMGLGHHLVAFAGEHPEYNHVGLEMKMHRIYTARHMALKDGVRHVRFVPGDAYKSLEAFGPGEVHLLTLLFPDPWPQEKFASKRLTHPDMVARFKRMLAPGGHMHFRTDDPDLFAYSCDTFRAAGFRLEQVVRLGRIKTGFERRWLSEGRQIYGFDAYPPG